MAALTSTALLGLTQNEFLAISPQGMPGLSSKEVAALDTGATQLILGTTAIDGLSSAQFGAITSTAMAGLGSTGLAALTVTEIAGFSTAQLTAITPTVLEQPTYSNAQTAAFTALLTPTQHTTFFGS